MKTAFSFVIVCLVLSFASLSQASRLQRALLQSPSPATVSVTSEAGCVVVNGRCAARASISTIVSHTRVLFSLLDFFCLRRSTMQLPVLEVLLASLSRQLMVMETLKPLR